MVSKLRLPSPALVVASVALFVALGGTAVAAAPVARALFANNAGKLQGKTLAAVVQQSAATAARLPGPASTAAGLVTHKSAADALAADGEKDVAVSCDAGKKVIGGGYASTGPVLGFDSRPTSDTTWSVYLLNLSTTQPANVTVYAVCLG